MNFAEIQRAILHPYPTRAVLMAIIKKFKLGSYVNRVKISAVDRPQYAYCVYHGAELAKQLGHTRISVIEFGVAGGNGLVSLETHAREVSKATGVQIDVYGFDTGEGLPSPKDYRDLKYFWKEGHYKMDVDALKSKLNNAQLILGDVQDTVKTFIKDYNPAPIAAVMHDLDFYSSTLATLDLFKEENQSYFLPRVFNYFDDVVGSDYSLYNDYTGERAAINDFNKVNENIKFSPAYHLLAKRVVYHWYHMIWVSHFFKHEDYDKFISPSPSEIKLSD